MKEKWVLRSGRVIIWETPERIAGSVYLDGDVPVIDVVGDDTPPVTTEPSIATSPLAPDERREFADAVIAGWNRWAETGSL
jgi:hypothetical protein